MLHLTRLLPSSHLGLLHLVLRFGSGDAALASFRENFCISGGVWTSDFYLGLNGRVLLALVIFSYITIYVSCVHYQRLGSGIIVS
ncbi:hypothetical protein K466DRAFT_402215 [Polyporus arcularius HHB13444]|uniref:Uncharacterized protein n=1 Tax=Polyporus arcularius HHB13444 TaxID=1314778 RepID=A0A5C3PPF5_9APHY|nr:hypothetical protein K466DRAFT_402215 [Polyporus arcularius HHB13444]